MKYLAVVLKLKSAIQKIYLSYYKIGFNPDDKKYIADALKINMTK
jgi:hypothetical protein